MLLSDFDKVFAILDGKYKPEIGLVDVFDNCLDELRSGQRISSSYFDVRYYRVGTIHFFPRSAVLVDRLNRLVGRHRQWLPPEGTRVSDAFWLQFESDKFDKEIRAEIDKKARNAWDHPLHRLFSSCTENREAAEAAIDESVTTVLERNGICVDFRVEEKGQQLLRAA